MIVGILIDSLIVRTAVRLYRYMYSSRPIGRGLLQVFRNSLDYRLSNIDLYVVYVVFGMFLILGLLPWLTCYYTANTADYNAPAGRFLFYDFCCNKRSGTLFEICWRVHADKRAKARFIDNRKAISNVKATGIILRRKDKANWWTWQQRCGTERQADDHENGKRIL